MKQIGLLQDFLSAFYRPSCSLGTDLIMLCKKGLSNCDAELTWTKLNINCMAGAQPRLKSWGGPRFGSQHRGACARPEAGRVGCGRGSPPPAVGSRGVTPGKFLKTQKLNPAFWWLALIIGLPRTCVYEQTTSMSRAKSVPKFQLFSRGC